VKYEIEITANCNAACPLCQRTEMGMPLRGNSEISYDDFVRIFPNEYVNGNFFTFSGTIGDPIVHPQLLDIVSYISSNGGKTKISTNGGYNNEIWWTQLASIDNLIVDFAIDGLENTNHIYRVNVKWNIVERNLRAFVNAGGNANWIYILFSHNKSEYETAKKFAATLGIPFFKRTSGKNIIFSKTHQIKDEVYEISNAPEIKHDVTSTKKVIELVNQSRVDPTISPKLMDAVGNISCKHLIENEYFVSADARLWPCCYIAGEYHYMKSNNLYDEYIENSEFDNDWNDLHSKTIKQIVDNPPFNVLQQLWNPNHKHHLDICLRTCSNNGEYLNKITKETL
jgi:MoaA/NifB/PqqE/SkfB family radical SAM enzyme